MNYLMSVEEKLYEARALLEVVMDGLCNDVTGINQDYYATTVRVALNSVEAAQNVVEQEFKDRRENMFEEQEASKQMQFPFEYQYSPGEGLDLQVGDRIQVSQSEDDEEGEEGDAGFSTGSLGVKLVEEHEDGSATFEVHGSKDQMGKLFSAFFTDAITRGIDCAEQQTDKWVLRSRILSKAKEFADLMQRWEWDDELDYEPSIKRVRCELSELIKEHGAVR